MRNNKYLYFIINFSLIIGILFFHYNLRISFFPKLYINIFAFLGFFLLFISLFKSNFTKINKKSFLFFISCLLLFIFLLINMIWNGNFNIVLLLSVCLPLFSLILYYNDVKSFEHFFIMFSNVLNILLLISFVFGIIDYYYDYSITNFFVRLFNSDAIIRMRVEEPYRIITFFGHPLRTSEIALIAFFFNILRFRYFNKKVNFLFQYVVPIGIIAFCGSKTAFILLLLSLIIINFNNKKLLSLFVLVFIISIFYNLGFFDSIINRFVSGFVSGDLSSGRNTSIVKLINDGEINFFLFKGHLDNYSSTYIAALEYPFLRFSYRNGIVFTCFLYLLIFIIPFKSLISSKKYYLLFCLIIIFIDVNSYSTICSTGDGMLLYCFFVFNILNFSRFFSS